jgi:hypothetical protein
MEPQEKIQFELNLDKQNLERAQAFFETYDFESIIGDTVEKYYLGNKEPRICRFCKKTEKEVTFKTDAHVIPQFMGNKKLLSYFECDECNFLFSKYETSCADYFGISRTFAQIRGQSNKVPKFKDPKTGLEVVLADTALQISTLEGTDVFKINEENKSLELITERPGYIPIHIPKTIIKMGLSMLSENDMPGYDYARRFLIQSEQDVNFKDSMLLHLYGYFIPGPPKFKKPFMHLYKKKGSIEKPCPNRQIILYYSNYCFQMILPYGDDDKGLQGKNINFPMFPLLIDNSHFEKFGKYQILHLNLTSSKKKKGEEHKLTFSFDSAEKIKG